MGLGLLVLIINHNSPKSSNLNTILPTPLGVRVKWFLFAWYFMQCRDDNVNLLSSDEELRIGYPILRSRLTIEEKAKENADFIKR